MAILVKFNLYNLVIRLNLPQSRFNITCLVFFLRTFEDNYFVS